MSNRAVIQFTPRQAVYIHWNGGRDSVEGLLNACAVLTARKQAGKLKGARLFEQVAKAFFEGKTTVEYGRAVDLDCDNGDNGLYYVDPRTWTITGRAYNTDPENDDAEKRKGVFEQALTNFAALARSTA